MDLPTRKKLVDITQVSVSLSGIYETFRNLPKFDTKADSTLVTEIDHAIQSEFFRRIKRSGLHLIGEEEGSQMVEGAKFAVAIDPLDGTGAFVRGIPTSACAVTILENRNGLWFPIMAVIQELTRDGWTWSAEEAGQTYFEYRNVKESECLIPTCSAPYRVTISSWPGAAFGLDSVIGRLNYAEFQNQAFGSIALGAGLIASGGTHATVFAGNSALETVAMMLIVRGAGGVATDMYGNDLAGFELCFDEKSGKPDFVLPDGAIMAANRDLAKKLSAKVLSMN